MGRDGLASRVGLFVGSPSLVSVTDAASSSSRPGTPGKIVKPGALAAANRPIPRSPASSSTPVRTPAAARRVRQPVQRPPPPSMQQIEQRRRALFALPTDLLAGTSSTPATPAAVDDDNADDDDDDDGSPAVPGPLTSLPPPPPPPPSEIQQVATTGAEQDGDADDSAAMARHLLQRWAQPEPETEQDDDLLNDALLADAERWKSRFRKPAAGAGDAARSMQLPDPSTASVAAVTRRLAASDVVADAQSERKQLARETAAMAARRRRIAEASDRKRRETQQLIQQQRQALQEKRRLAQEIAKMRRQVQAQEDQQREVEKQAMTLQKQLRSKSIVEREAAALRDVAEQTRRDAFYRSLVLWMARVDQSDVVVRIQLKQRTLRRWRNAVAARHVQIAQVAAASSFRCLARAFGDWRQAAENRRLQRAEEQSAAEARAAARAWHTAVRYHRTRCLSTMFLRWSYHLRHARMLAVEREQHERRKARMQAVLEAARVRHDPMIVNTTTTATATTNTQHDADASDAAVVTAVINHGSSSGAEPAPETAATVPVPPPAASELSPAGVLSLSHRPPSQPGRTRSALVQRPQLPRNSATEQRAHVSAADSYEVVAAAVTLPGMPGMAARAEMRRRAREQRRRQREAAEVAQELAKLEDQRRREEEAAAARRAAALKRKQQAQLRREKEQERELARQQALQRMAFAQTQHQRLLVRHRAWLPWQRLIARRRDARARADAIARQTQIRRAFAGWQEAQRYEQQRMQVLEADAETFHLAKVLANTILAWERVLQHRAMQMAAAANLARRHAKQRVLLRWRVYLRHSREAREVAELELEQRADAHAARAMPRLALAQWRAGAAEAKRQRLAQQRRLAMRSKVDQWLSRLDDNDQPV